MESLRGSTIFAAVWPPEGLDRLETVIAWLETHFGGELKDVDATLMNLWITRIEEEAHIIPDPLGTVDLCKRILEQAIKAGRGDEFEPRLSRAVDRLALRIQVEELLAEIDRPDKP